MVMLGTDENGDVYPLRLDSNGRLQIVIDDGSGNTMPAMDDKTRAGFVKVTDGSYIADVDSSGRQLTACHQMRPDGVNTLKPLDTVGRAGFVKLTDGTHSQSWEKEDGSYAKDGYHMIVVCLNYVWDAVNSKWVRMTQP